MTLAVCRNLMPEFSRSSIKRLLFCQLLAGWLCGMSLLLASPAMAELTVHGAFSDNMVLQRDKPVVVWGTADPQSTVTVGLLGATATVAANDRGRWSIELPAMPANSTPTSMVISTADPQQKIVIENILVGDVWLCGGQSNMEFELAKIYQGDVEIASANFPSLRLMTIPAAATPELQSNFQALNEYNDWSHTYEQKGSWQVCSPDSVKKFAAIGYIFARRLHMASGVPIGMIDNSVGGTTVEGWTSRDSLKNIPEAQGLLTDWDRKISQWDPEQDLKNRQQRWEQDTERRRQNGQPATEKPTDLQPGPAFDRNNPGASFNAMVAPLEGLRIRGIIFHQGYNNALGDARPQLYAKTIKAMIGDWRRVFQESDLPFGIIELCAGAEPQTLDNFEIRMVDAGPYIREAQFQAYRDLPNMGWATAYDQQVDWYHPQQKVALAERMARWALATEYDMKWGHQPAMLVEHKIQGSTVELTFDRELTVKDGRPIEGMAIAADDQRFYPAEARFAVARKDDRGRDVMDYRRVVVSHPLVTQPVAVRYAWARCPLGNLTHREHMERELPIPSFRTDQWNWPEAPFGDQAGSVRKLTAEMRQQATRNAADRKIQQARWLLQQQTPNSSTTTSK